MAMVIRAELFQPGLQLVEPNFFNQMTTVHGLIMVFGAVMPAFTGLANWMVPLMIGAPDMALPRMNNWSFLDSCLLRLPCCWPHCSWKVVALTLAGPSMHPYQPTYSPESTGLFVFAIHIMGISSIMGAINVIVTIVNMACTGNDLHEDAAVRLDLADHGFPG